MEETSKKPNQLISKVTLSCRVTAEQKLLIARRAKENGMSLAEYAEAKVLLDDDLVPRHDYEHTKLQNKYLREKMKILYQFKKDVANYFEDFQMNDFYAHHGHEGDDVEY